MKRYLRQAGLDEFADELSEIELNSFVEESFSESSLDLSAREIEKLYFYDIPKISAEGTCSLKNEKEDQPYNLARTLGLIGDFKSLADNPQTLRIWRLYRVVDKIMKFVAPDWFGIYRKIIDKEGRSILIKEAYAGAFSRAEFPLNEEFAAQSNNSTVGLKGKARYFADLSAYNGPYYECDNKVQSEYCGPILTPNGDVIGIVDAESFQKNFFTSEKILQLTKVCRDLGEINLGLETAR